MADSIIQIEHLSKRFIISHEQRERYSSLRDEVVRKTKSAFSFGRRNTQKSMTREEFWALKDVNFEVRQGDRMGIIGRNGAGKSTLLKILSRVTEPSLGRVTMNGRVASLLEVGTGFHQELTGRENIFLNGAILGMSRTEIRKKFDEIVAFAEVENFLDTPVKRYSSGMYVRLAFAIAAHLEPEILIVDEVLAVGDTQFQRKCIGKMEDVSKRDGRTVLFVSHDLNAVRKLCNTAIMFEKGSIAKNGFVDEVVEAYLSLTSSGQNDQRFVRSGTGDVELKDIVFKDSSHHEIKNLTTGSFVRIEMICKSKKDLKNIQFAICFNDMFNSRVTSIWTAFHGISHDVELGIYSVVFKVKNLGLIPGTYQLISYINWGEVTIERIDNFRTVSVSINERSLDFVIPTNSQGHYLENFEIEISKVN